MTQPVDTPRPLSVWAVNSDQVADMYISDTRDAETICEPLVNTPVQLLDPPRQYSEFYKDPNEDSTEEPPQKMPAADKEALKKQIEQYCDPSSSKEDKTLRPAPSTDSRNQQVNTVEIVKKDGMYSVVLDGVSQGVIKPSRDSHANYWLPRFKESMVNKNGKLVRTTKPVLFSVRLEDYEGVPESCTVHVLQKVVNDGKVVMDNKEVTKQEITPYSTGSSFTEAVVYPYPLISTPEPHFHINDYGLMRKAEYIVQAHNNTDLRTAARKLESNATKYSVKDSIKEYIQSVKGIITNYFEKEIQKGVDAVDRYTTVKARETLYSLMQRAKFDMTDNTRNRMLAAHDHECSKTVRQHRVGMTELPKMLRRISETRANGALLDGTDQTLGMSVHDLGDLQWHKEAAFLHWLQNGEGSRYKEKKGTSITGQYTLEENQEHHQRLRDLSNSTDDVTFNTINRSGMDPLTLSNTRTQFSFMIKIVESNGQPGTTINLQATRLNGIDAGWVSAGYDELINKIRYEVNCLEFRLMSLPSVTRQMNKHSTLVYDSRDDFITGRKSVLDIFGHVKASYAADYEETLKRFADKESKRLGKATEDLRKSREALAKANKAVAQLQNDRHRLDENYNARVQAINNDPNLQGADNAERRQRKLNTLERFFTTAQKRLQDRLERRQTSALDKEQDARVAARKAQASQIRTSHTKYGPQFATVIDYGELLERLRSELLGYEYETYTSETTETTAGMTRDTNVTQKRWWTKVFGLLAGSNNQDSSVQEAKQKANIEHAEYCITALSGSLGVRKRAIQESDVLYKRFTGIFSPVYSTTHRVKNMRFASFVVPGVHTWLQSTPTGAQSIVRMLPQVVVFSAKFVSAFGNVKLIQPLSLEDSELVEEQTKGKNAVHVMSKTLKRLSELQDLPNVLVWNNMCHFIQVYKKKQSTWEAKFSTVFDRPLDTTKSSIDCLATAALPTKETMRHVYAAVIAGGDNMIRDSHVTAGRNANGARKLLTQLGCNQGYSGLLAVATFSEILAHHVLQYGASVAGGKGLRLQYRELIDNVKSMSQRVAQIVSKFIITYYTSTTKTPCRMPANDVAFYCLPGMTYTRIALRRTGVMQDIYNSNLSLVALDDYKRRFLNDFALSLFKLASHRAIDPSIFPFTCAQSVIGGVPPAIKALTDASFTDSVSAQIATLCHSYKRTQIMTDVRTQQTRPRDIVCIRVDCICSRPIVLKMAAVHKLKTMRVIVMAMQESPQLSWSKPTPPLNSHMLKHRLAGMRAHIEQEVLEGSVQTPLVSNDTEEGVYKKLVDKMLDLDVRGPVSIDKSKHAIFMIPFGVYNTGSTSDIAWMNFEMRPVWVADLKAAAIRAKLEGLTPYTTKTEMTVRVDGPTLDGRPRHPFCIIAFTNCVSVYGDSGSRTDTTTDKLSPVDPRDTDKLIDAIALINNAPEVNALSGALSESYRSIMHNSERLFQACLLIASGMYHDRPPSNGILAQVDLQTTMAASSLAVSACIGNALAYAATGMPIRVVVSSPTKDAQWHKQIALAAGSVERACNALIENGVAAVPFSEVCCAFSNV